MNDRKAPEEEHYLLTDAASRALDELLAQRRQEVVDFAKQTTEPGGITATDIVRAYYSSRGGLAPLPSADSLPFERRRQMQITTLILAATMTLLAGVVPILMVSGVLTDEESSPVSLSVITIIVTLISTIFGAMAAATAVSSRRSKAMAERVRVFSVLASEAGRFELTQDDSRETDFNDSRLQIMYLAEWEKLENRLRHLGQTESRERSAPHPVRPPIGTVIGRLEANGRIDAPLLQDIRSVVKIRNMIAHRSPVSRAQSVHAMALLKHVGARLEVLEEEAPVIY
ncbi:hypothetical protein SAMN05660473_02848 [Arthrobacter sp. 49Tsu3.1M3]|uniref:hypothetical protein n=1 Tax=Arthrobacter sp. 49Tsu3.1M3 TaxID=1279029 RepID=UPI0009C86535|nr:hypothetical protein [Arthrobacter sp. 49Tsu3.1M3]SKB88395.1 hypothetical protein SAMN05660473_02848 [Arthrobacter sp. 49Tsu3.1M3]